MVKTMNKKKLALFSTNFLEYSQTFIFDEINNHKNYDVEVFSHNLKNQDKFFYKKVNFIDKRNSFFKTIEWLLYGITTYSPSFVKKFKKNNYDIIHAHFGLGTIYALRYKKIAKIPLVATFHGYDVPVLLTKQRFLPKFWRYWLCSKSMLKNVDLFLAASNELKDLLIKIGAPKDKIKVWRLGIDIPNITLKEKSGTQVLMVGRFVEKKGFEYGIQGFANVIKKGINATLNIIGNGDLESKYKEIIKLNGIEKNVKFLGVLNHEDVLRTMENMDILLAPSVVASNGDRESGLIVAKEASARFLPVIGSYHGGIPEIIDHEKTGFLVKEKDFNGIAKFLEKLLLNKNLREKLGKAGREKMEKEYDIKKRVEVLEQYYDTLLKQYNKGN